MSSRSLVVSIAVLLSACPSPTPTQDGGAGGTATAGGSNGGGAAGGGAAGAGAAGGGAAGGTLTADAGDPLSTFCARHAAVYCAREASCNAASSASCASWRRDDCERTVLLRARAGALRFDAGAADACLQRLVADGCSASIDCFVAAFAPAARLGERCESGDCAEGFCAGTARWTEGGCPVCTAFPADGQLCVTATASLPCGPGSYCDYVNDGGAEVCRPRKPDGASCVSDSECLTRCNDEPGPSRRCGFVALGASCSDTSQCTPGTRCFGARESAPGMLFMNGTCQATVPLGGVCTEEQLDDLCVYPATCLSGRCEVRSGGAAGAPCDNFTQCESGACDRPRNEPDGGARLLDGACRPRLDAGEPCEATGAKCMPGLYCGADGGCSAPLPAGAACVGGDCGTLSCLGDLTGRRCAAAPALGEPCPDGACGFGFCLPTDGGPSRCALLPDGAACMGPPRCDSYRCDRASSGAAPLCAPSCFAP